MIPSVPGQPIDQFARTLERERQSNILKSASLTSEARVDVLSRDLPDAETLRKVASQIKEHTLDHLDRYLEHAEDQLRAAGADVHYAIDASSARQTILQILRSSGARRVVKSKSMATEEIDLNPFLEENGLEVVESDLGEFIVQIEGDHPSHIVRPIIHLNRREVADSFERIGLGDLNDDPGTITRRARAHLREKFLASDAGITGGNFLCAESGRIVLVTNEGNARFGMAANEVHIAVVGIEKIVPREKDLQVFLNLLARSATAQQITVYTQFIRGPRAAGQPSGPRHMHVVLLDNGRTDIMRSNCREILRCIRCGACQNVCPVYRQAGGHAYRAVYGGPVGAVLSPLLASRDGRFSDFADLPKASSLCGACREVCPVDIPIPDMLLKLRARAKEEHLASPGSPPMKPFGALATSPQLWRMALTAGRATNLLPPPSAGLPLGALSRWLATRTLPRWRGGEFRQWMTGRGSVRAVPAGGSKSADPAA